MTWRVLDIIKTSSDFLEKKGVPDARLDAEILLGKVINKNRLELYLYFDRPLNKIELDRYREFIQRRGKREPLQHILGEVEFMNSLIKVNTDVLIPRPETEVLVENVLERITSYSEERILDLGTGSGCIAIALSMERKRAKILAVDKSQQALKLAKENSVANHTEVAFQEVDILKHLPSISQRFHLVVSNPPYIAPHEKNDLQVEVRDFDPEMALFDEVDGLTFYRRYAKILPELLTPGGHFLFEFGGKPQEKHVLDIFTEGGYHDLEIIQDYNGDPRIIAGVYKP